MIAASHWQHGAEGLRPDPELTVSEWADANRELSRRESPEPGPWRTDRTPYLREIMDCLSVTSPVQRVVLMAASQVGKSESGHNWIGYVIQHAPGPMMVVQPTGAMIKRFSKHRLKSLIESTPALGELIHAARSRDGSNTIEMKEFPGGVLVLASAESPVQLASMPVRYLFIDEADAAPAMLEEEGDALDIAEQRTENFGRRRKILIVSTPRRPKGFSRIESEYLASDQRRFWVPCRICGEHQYLTWEQVEWPPGHAERAVYVCWSCAGGWRESARLWSIAHGEWRAEKPFRGTAGFHLSALYSPWLTIPRLAREFEAKKTTERRRTFVNLKLGETYEQKGEQIDPTGLIARRENYDPSPLPEGVCVITAAGDVQGDRVELEILGWGVGEQNWSLDYRVVPGDPSTPELWEAVDHQLLRTFQHPWGEELRIVAACIDSGGHHTKEVYRFCRERYMRRVWAIKGFAGEGRPIIETPSLQKPFVKVGVDSAKKRVYDRLGIPTPGPGFCHFPHRYEQEYFDQLTAEKMITVFRAGRPVRAWVLKNPEQPNHALDVRGYNVAALAGLNPDLKIAAEQLAVRAEERRKAMQLAPVGADDDDDAPTWPPRGRGGWGTRW